MKQDMPKGLVIAIIAAVAVLAIGGAFFMSGRGGAATADETKLEDMQAEAAKQQYSGYQNGGTGGATSGPPVSGEGAAQQASPGGQPATGN